MFIILTRKYSIRHLWVIVLPGVDEELLMLLPQLAQNLGALDKLGPGSDNGDDLHTKG
jgi:hypothetical protein